MIADYGFNVFDFWLTQRLFTLMEYKPVGASAPDMAGAVQAEVHIW